MVTHRPTAVVGTVFFAHLINAIPTTALYPYLDSVLYFWSTEPICSTTAKKADCATAYAGVCSRSNLKTSANATVGDCTAFYWYDAGNTIPTGAECTAAYERILANSIGGSLGYDDAKNRTNDPLYAVYPKDGNANCFKAAGDTSPVLAPNALPGGGTLSTCPVSTSRRRQALDTFETGEDDGSISCIIEDGVWEAACTAVCLTSVTATSWITGPFVVAGWLACLGGCTATGLKVYNNCQIAKGHTGPEYLISGIFGKREEADESVNPCVNIKQWEFQCPAQQAGLLSHYKCQQTINT